jgi:hypothetical protein
MPAGLFTQHCSAFISHAHLHCSVDVAFHQLSDIRWRRMALPKELCQTHGEDVRAGAVIHSSSIPPLKQGRDKLKDALLEIISSITSP